MISMGLMGPHLAGVPWDHHENVLVMFPSQTCGKHVFEQRLRPVWMIKYCSY
jgi:hypothetical protein